MPDEQVFGKSIDSEHLFVVQYRESEQVFGKGDAVSVALELEYETVFPRLRVVPEPIRRAPARRHQHLWVILGVVTVGLLVLLALPIRSIGGKAIAGSAPVVGQVYVVQPGDSLQSIAQRVNPTGVSSLVKQLAAEAGSSTIVPGEHLLIP